MGTYWMRIEDWRDILAWTYEEDGMSPTAAQKQADEDISKLTTSDGVVIIRDGVASPAREDPLTEAVFGKLP